MASFPQVPRVTTVELFVNGSWTDISSDVYARGGIAISRGDKDEQSQFAPSSCQLTIDNRSGNYSPRNPAGIYYGSIGRNTPIRLSVELASDTFARTVSSGWGTSDTGQTYTLVGTGGTVTNANWNVASGVGTMSITGTNATRAAVLNGISLRDVDVSGQVTIPVTDITGGSVQPINIELRRQADASYIYAGLKILTDESVQVGIFHSDGTALGAFTTVAGLTHSSAQALTLRAQADGQTFRAKAWATTAGEPYGWQVTANSDRIMAAGNIGVFSWINSANTNSRPIVFSIDNLVVQIPRFAGEVASWPQRWDITGNDTFVAIEAAAITRRLGQGAVPLRSALYRYYERLAIPPVSYWPCEDRVGSATIAPSSLSSATAIGSLSSVGGIAFISDSVVTHPTTELEFAAYSNITSSAPLVQLGKNPTYDPAGGSTTSVVVTGYSGITSAISTVYMVRFIFHMPVTSSSDAEPADNITSLILIECTGTLLFVEVKYRTSGLLSVEFTNSSGVTAYASGPINYGDIRGRDVLMTVQLTQTGADVLWNLSVLDVGQGKGLQTGLTVTGLTIGYINTVGLDTGGANLLGSAYGHISIRSELAPVSEITAPLAGYAGETAGTRIQRLCSEQSIPFGYRGDLLTTSAVGAQGAGQTGGGSNTSLLGEGSQQTLLDLLRETAAADTGTLYEPRGDIGIAYRTRSSLYSQDAQLDLDYSAGHVAPPLEPVDDDQLTRNNIIVTRINAGSAEAELTTGRMSTLDPSLGGVGEYDTQYTLNVATDAQLPELATWLLTLGTVDEARYPTITVNLANPDFAAAGLESDALAVDIGDRITISNPKTGQAPDQITQLVRGYTETINVFEHRITFNCSPETPYEIAQIDSNPQYKIASDTSTLVAGGNATVGSFSVANVNEPWTTDPAQMPIQIVVVGEQMSVTAISGTSTPQTFTVTRSVNGIVKTQLAGAVVQLIRRTRPIIGL